MPTISKPVLLGGGIVLTAIIAFLAFGVFGIHTAFIDDEVSEANPFAVVAEVPADDGEESPAETGETINDDAMQDSDTDDAMQDSDTDDAMEDSDTDDAMQDESSAAPEIVTVTSGSFVSNSRYTTVGEGFTITDGSQTFLRFEQFETNNGPDLNVYLRNSEDPDDYIDLGDLKGNIGDQNYELPADIDLERYDFVDIWCVRFGVSFGSATLTTA